MKKVLIQCATPSEFEALQQTFDISKVEKAGKRSYFLTERGWIILRGGVGKVRAASSCEYAIGHWIPRLFVDFGASGGLVPTLKAGDIVCSHQVVEHDVRESESGGSLPMIVSDQRDQGIHPMIRGLIASGDQDICSLEDRQALHLKTQAVAVTWESAAIAKVCQFHEIPWLSIRVITDTGHGGDFLEEYRAGISKFLKPAAEVMRDYVISASA